jgi:heat shock protein HtpX
MTPAVGLRTHIWNNNLKSVVLLAGFPVLLFLPLYALSLIYVVDAGVNTGSLAGDLRFALDEALLYVPHTLVAAGIWFVAAWFFHQRIIDASVKARPIGRQDEPRVWNLLENLCISRGVPMPSLRIIESSAMNAYASGLTPERSAVTVTRGLLDGLDDAELEAVLAHELTHILNRDVRLLVVAVIFVGIFSFIAEAMGRGGLRVSLARSGGGRRGRSGNAGLIVIVAIAAIAIAWIMAQLVRLAMSRSREYMADAGAVELTRNPDAMIGALEKISGRSTVEEAPDELRQMFLHDTQTAFGGLFATHPPISKRIEALRRYAGGSLGSVEGSGA